MEEVCPLKDQKERVSIPQIERFPKTCSNSKIVLSNQRQLSFSVLSSLRKLSTMRRLQQTLLFFWESEHWPSVDQADHLNVKGMFMLMFFIFHQDRIEDRKGKERTKRRERKQRKKLPFPQRVRRICFYSSLQYSFIKNASIIIS